MWSRPIRMPAANSFPRLIFGAAARSSHTAELCVMVTSLSTPSPPTMMPTINSSRKFIPGRSCARSYSFSSAKPDNRANSADSAPNPTVIANPSSVPARAVDVRIETPCAT